MSKNYEKYQILYVVTFQKNFFYLNVDVESQYVRDDSPSTYEAGVSLSSKYVHGYNLIHISFYSIDENH